jgi:hypothetical protein
MYQNQPRPVRSLWVLTLAVAALLAPVHAPLHAQVRVGEDGRAGDANTRVGSGGYNTPRPNLQLASPNDIALGNVTGGRAFRGRLTGDPSQAFGGRSSLASDRFGRRANPNIGAGLPPGTYAVPFYSASPVGNAPRGFVLDPTSGMYRSVQAPQRGVEDIQFNVPPGTPVLRPGADGSAQLLLPAVLKTEEGSFSPVMMTATPLLGIRPLPRFADEDRFLVARSAPVGGLPDGDVSTVRRLRDEIRASVIAADPVAAQAARDANAERSRLEAERTSPLVRGAVVAGQEPTDAAVRDGKVSEKAMRGDIGDIFSPATRNPLVEELKRLDQQRRDVAKAAPVSPGPAGSALPGQGTSPSTRPAEATSTRPSTELKPLPANTPVADVPETLGFIKPIQVESLAARVGDGAFRELLASAEAMMAEGRFSSAIDRYDAALRYSRSDVTLVAARAHAELGAGYFERAATSLRLAITYDPSMLNAQYDLRKAFGQARYDTLVTDLKQIAVEETGSATPLTMLAYLAYNGGDIPRAISLLDEALKRDSDNATLLAMKARWGAPDSNK